jgi:hypothetical protein
MAKVSLDQCTQLRAAKPSLSVSPARSSCPLFQSAGLATPYVRGHSSPDTERYRVASERRSSASFSS